MNPPGFPVARLARRLAAIAYDAMLLVAMLFLATLLLLPAVPGGVVDPGNIPYMLYLATVAWLYFGWHWTHGGQTLGMKAWRLRLRRLDGGDPSMADATLRFACAILSWLPAGAGFVWSLIDRNGLAWHDRLSRTVLEVTPRTGHPASGATG